MADVKARAKSEAKRLKSRRSVKADKRLSKVGSRREDSALPKGPSADKAAARHGLEKASREEIAAARAGVAPPDSEG